MDAALDPPALWTAAEGGHVKDVLQLLSIDVAINEIGIRRQTWKSEGYTPLHVAVYMGHVEVVQILLENGADVSLKTTFVQGTRSFYSYGHSALYLACAGDESTAQEAIILALIKHGADLHAEDEKGFRPLSKAILHRSITAIKLLLKHGADISLPHDDGLNAIHWAIQRHNDLAGGEKMRILFAGQHLHYGTPDPWAGQPVHIPPLSEKAKEVVRTLLTQSTDVFEMIDALGCEKLIISDTPPSGILTRRAKARLRRQRRHGLNDPPDQYTGNEDIKEMLRDALLHAQEARRGLLQAFTLGQHKRLGAASHIRALDPEMVQMIMDRV
jgi:hypothetical protein